MAYEWDDAKRAANLVKHGLDFNDAWRVYEAPDYLDISSTRDSEPRTVRVAFVKGIPLALVHVLRGGNVRVISLRRARPGEWKPLKA
jgi:uncharacterized protein